MRRDAGQATIEVVALVPLLVLVALIVVQVGIVGYTVSSANNAARAGARAASRCDDGEAVARSAPPTWLRDGTQADVTVEAGVARSEVRLRVPVLFSVVELPSPVVRRAAFPVTGRC